MGHSGWPVCHFLISTPSFLPFFPVPVLFLPIGFSSSPLSNSSIVPISQRLCRCVPAHFMLFGTRSVRRVWLSPVWEFWLSSRGSYSSSWTRGPPTKTSRCPSRNGATKPPLTFLRHIPTPLQIGRVGNTPSSKLCYPCSTKFKISDPERVVFKPLACWKLRVTWKERPSLTCWSVDEPGGHSHTV